MIISIQYMDMETRVNVKTNIFIQLPLLTYIELPKTTSRSKGATASITEKELAIQIHFLSIKPWVLSVYFTIGIINMATFFF